MFGNGAIEQAESFRHSNKHSIRREPDRYVIAAYSLTKILPEHVRHKALQN
jgi:hypothetical protein